MSFIPSGFRRLTDVRDQFGAEQTGEKLASGEWDGFFVSQHGSMHSIRSTFWRTKAAASVMRTGIYHEISLTRLGIDPRQGVDVLIPTQNREENSNIDEPAAETESLGENFAPHEWMKIEDYLLHDPAIREAHRRLRHAGIAVSDRTESMALSKLWTEAGRDGTADSFARTARKARRKHRMRPSSD